jgi:S1-C subfamily serine protease
MGAMILLMVAPMRAQTAVGNTTVTGGDFMALQQRYIELFNQTRPAVVKIKILASDGITYLSTGFFVSKEGYIVTANAHLLSEAVRVVFEHDGVPYIADVVGVDLVTNVALLHAPKLPADFGVLDLPGDAELPPIGTMLLAVTCKHGDDAGPSPGILQGYDVKHDEQSLHALFLRTNIPDDGAESGSPVFDLEGRLVGLMVVTLPEMRSISLLLPTRALLRVREDLLNHGHVLYGHFGFSGTQIVTAEAGSQVLVDDVEYGGPAATAGLKVGDLLLAMDGVPIHADADLIQATFFAHPGEYVTMKVRREGNELSLPLLVGEMKMEAAPAPGENGGNTTTGTSGNSTATPGAANGVTGNVTGGNASTEIPPPLPPVESAPSQSSNVLAPVLKHLAAPAS